MEGGPPVPAKSGSWPLSQTRKERQLSAERDSLTSMRAPSPGRAQDPRPIRPFPVSGSEPTRPPLQGTGTPRPGLGALPATEVALGTAGRQLLLPADAQWGHVRSTCSWGSAPRDTRGKSVMIVAFSVTPLGVGEGVSGAVAPAVQSRQRGGTPGENTASYWHRAPRRLRGHEDSPRSRGYAR